MLWPNFTVRRPLGVGDWAVVVKLLANRFDFGSPYWLDVLAVELQVPQQLLALPRICFVLEAVSGPPHDSVEHCGFFVVFRTWPKPVGFFELVEGFQSCLKPFEVCLGAHNCQVVAVH